MSYSSNDTSEDLHPKPSLVDSNTIDKAMNESANNITSTPFRNLTTDNNTDLGWQHLANEDKMVKEQDRIYFGKTGDETSEISSYSSSKSSSSYNKHSKHSVPSDHGTSDAINNTKQPHGINISTIPTQQNNNTQHNTHHNDHHNHHSHHHNSFHSGASHESNQTPHEQIPPKPAMSKEELKLEKVNMLRKLAELYHNGVVLSQKYTIDSDLDEMKFEYELHSSIRAKQNSVNWMSSVLMNCVYGIEMMNEKYDPFSVNLTGWGQEMSRNSGSYCDVFGELYEKYNKPGKSVPPEIKLLFMITGSATKFALQNAAVGALPNLTEKFKSNPELAANLRAKAQADKLKQMDENQQKQMEQYINKQHTDAVEKMNSLKMLEEKKKEFMIKQDAIRRQEELNNLQEQLGSNSPSLSSYQNNNVNNNANNNANNGGTGVIKQVLFPHGMVSSKPVQNNQQINPSFPTQPSQIPHDNIELYRQQSINQQKNFMQQQELMKQQEMEKNNKFNFADNVSTGETHVQLNPRLQELMRSNNSNETDSKLSSVSVSNADNISSNSRVILKRKKKKT